jgi:hypothetical protein
MFEHPWLFPQAKLLRDSNPDVKLVYSSHNVEWKLKHRILKPYLGTEVESISTFIRDLEHKIALNVDAIICVASTDADWYTEISGKPVLIANNASGLLETVTQAQLPIAKNYGLIIGSAHPPNIDGCLNFINDADLWLPSEFRLKIVGTLSNALQSSFKDVDKIDLINYVSDEDLTNLVRNASCIALPIAYGAGTNLKTAEALLSGRPIVGSKVAFRGFENFTTSENVIVTDDPFSFKRGILYFLHQNKSDVVRKSSEVLTWSYSLKLLPEFLMKVVSHD